MAQFDLTADSWAEVVPAGTGMDQSIAVEMGQALVSIGAPDALKTAFKIGGTEDRTAYVPAGFPAYARPSGPRARLTVGAASGLGIPANALISRIDASPLISRIDGSILVSRIAA